MVPDFSLYTPEELLDDPAFVGPVLQGRYAQEFPAPTPAIAEAARLILSLRYEMDRLDEGEQAELWSQIQSKISPAKVRRIIPLWLCAAAAAIILPGIGVSFFLAQQPVTVSTAYSQLRTIILPDHSIVTLNAHSTIRYKGREV